MFQLRRVALGAACALMLASTPLSAETPQDSLVMDVADLRGLLAAS